MTTFKQFIAEDGAEKMAAKMAQHMLGSMDVDQLHGDQIDFDNMLTGSRKHGHKFVDTVNGPWVLTHYQKGDKNIVKVVPPKGSSKPTTYFVPKGYNESITRRGRQLNEGMRLHPSKPPKGKKIVIVYDATDGGPLDDEMPRVWKEFGNLFDKKKKLSPEAIEAAYDARDVKKGEEYADEKALQHLTVWTRGDVSESDIINYVNKKLTASGTTEDLWYG